MRVDDDTAHTSWCIVWRAQMYTYLTNADRPFISHAHSVSDLNTSYNIIRTEKTQYHWVTEYNDVFCVLCDIFQSNLMAVKRFQFHFCVFSFHGSAGIIKAF